MYTAFSETFVFTNPVTQKLPFSMIMDMDWNILSELLFCTYGKGIGK